MSTKPEIAGWTERWVQDGDCNTTESDYQYLQLESQNNGMQDYFFIKTERWALDGDEASIDEFAAMLKKFMKIEKTKSVPVPGTVLIQENLPPFEPLRSHLVKSKTI